MKQLCFKCQKITKHKISTGGFKCTQCGGVERYPEENENERPV